MSRRTLDFRSFQDVLVDLQRLRKDGYQPIGNWDLAQVCAHLAFFIEGALDGQKFKTPWLLRTLFGRPVLRRILTQRRMKVGIPAPRPSIPSAVLDESSEVQRLQRLFERLEKHRGAYHPSPFFGDLTAAQWRELSLIHAAHHLSYLRPKAPPG